MAQSEAASRLLKALDQSLTDLDRINASLDRVRGLTPHALSLNIVNGLSVDITKQNGDTYRTHQCAIPEEARDIQRAIERVLLNARVRTLSKIEGQKRALSACLGELR